MPIVTIQSVFQNQATIIFCWNILESENLPEKEMEAMKMEESNIYPGVIPQESKYNIITYVCTCVVMVSYMNHVMTN